MRHRDSYKIVIWLSFMAVILFLYPELLFADELRLTSDIGREGSKDPFVSGYARLHDVVSFVVHGVVPLCGVAALAFNIVLLFAGKFSGRYMAFSVAGAIASGLIVLIWDWLSGAGANNVVAGI